jgi:DNA helicase-2/ATP-dependent DNA helicase PcrA
MTASAMIPCSVPTEHLFEALNSAQRQAVEQLQGPLLVLAGAGTGKTRVLTTRIAHILLTRRAHPSEVLAVTFTNKAAQEMRERVEKLIGNQVQGLWLGTFHSLCVRILRRHAELIDRHPDFTILDTDDQLRLLKQLLKAENIDDKKLPPRMLLYHISRWKDRGLSPDRVSVTELDQDNTLTLKLYKLYQERLKILNAMDFGDLILLTLTLFQTHGDTLRTYQEKFKYILVDEYQDTNVAQYLWLRLLAMGSHNLCCVGDDDQAIYGWRGAEVSNILRFERDFSGATVIRLEENYRSTPHILAAASGLITHNDKRLGKTLWTQRSQGDKVKIKCLWDSDEEARYVGEEIENLQRQGFSLSSMAILVRAAYQTREFEDRLITLGIPYRVVGGPRFYERQEIRDALAYLRVVAQPHDSLAFERIINVPRRGIGNAALQTLHQYARLQDVSLFEAARVLVETDELKGQARKNIKDLLQDFLRWQQRLSFSSPGELAKIVLDESGYTSMWQQDKSPDAPGRLENLKELVGALKEFDSLVSFLEHVSLVMENTAAAANTFDLVNIMTLHSAKGLEFGVVFLAGWEEGIFPNTRSIEEGHLEEERRLGYVGLTRAKQKAYITYVMSRRMYGSWQPAIISRFIDELPRDHIHFEKQPQSTQFSKAPSRARYLMENDNGPIRRPTVAHASTPSSTLYQRGDRVFHLKFGYGVVCSTNGDKLEIQFDHSGRKHVVASFVQPASTV